MTDGEDKGKGFLDSLKPTWRDAIYAGIGALATIKLPKYVENALDSYQRKQAKLLAEELRKSGEPYKTEKAGEG